MADIAFLVRGTMAAILAFGNRTVVTTGATARGHFIMADIHSAPVVKAGVANAAIVGSIRMTTCFVMALAATGRIINIIKLRVIHRIDRFPAGSGMTGVTDIRSGVMHRIIGCIVRMAAGAGATAVHLGMINACFRRKRCSGMTGAALIGTADVISRLADRGDIVMTTGTVTLHMSVVHRIHCGP